MDASFRLFQLTFSELKKKSITNGPTNGQTLLKRCEDASRNGDVLRETDASRCIKRKRGETRGGVESEVNSCGETAPNMP